MKSKLLIISILSIFLLSSLASALSFSQSYSQDLVKVRERWSYTEDTTGKLRGFNLVHVFFVPKDNIKIVYNDKPSTTTTTTITSNGLSVGGSFGGINNGQVGLSSELGGSFGSGFGGSFGNDKGLSEAFSTFKQNNRGQGTVLNSGSYRVGW